MSLTTTKEIYLDFYHHNIVTVTAKKNDISSRFVKVVCTNHGKKVFLDPNSVSVYIRFEKPDGNFVLNDTTITEDGTVLIELTQQMLAVEGKSKVDLLVTSLANVTADSLTDIEGIYEAGATVISTMTFSLNIFGVDINESQIVSLPEYSTLTNGIVQLAYTEKTMRELESTLTENEIQRENNETVRESNESERNTNEEQRQANETNRIAREDVRILHEDERIQSENLRQYNETVRIDNEILRQDNISGEAYRIANEEARKNAEILREQNMEQKLAQWADDVKSIVTQTGLVTQSEKGAPSGVATLNENGIVPPEQLDLSTFIQDNLTTTEKGYLMDASQGNEIRISLENLQTLISNMQTAFQASIDALPKIHFNSTVDHTIGKNGDALLVPVD